MNYKPNLKGDGVRFARAKDDPRVKKLAPLFERYGNLRDGEATKKQWRELAAELRAVRANACAAYCERMAK